MDSSPSVNGKKRGRPRKSTGLSPTDRKSLDLSHIGSKNTGLSPTDKKSLGSSHTGSKNIGLSPTDTKVYSRRERKPKVWEDFETESDEASENQRKKPGHASKSAGVNKSTSERFDNEDKSEEVLTKEQATANKKELDKTGTSKKGKRRSGKTNNDTLDETREKLELETVNDGIMKDGTAVVAETIEVPMSPENKNKRRRIVLASQSNEDGFTDADERPAASEKEIEKLRDAVESKRTSKFIEKCDRVIERNVELDTHMGNINTETLENGVSIKTEPGLTDTQFVTNSKINVGETNKAAAQKKTPGRKRGRPRKSIIEEKTSPVEHNEKDLNSCDNTEHAIENVTLDLDESAKLLNTPVSAPVKKRGRKKIIEEEEDSVANVTEVLLNIATKRRGRKKKSGGEAADETSQDLNTSQGSSRRGRKRKEINYAAIDDGDDLNRESDEGDSRLSIKTEELSDHDEDDNSGDDSYIDKTPSRKTPSKKGKVHACFHCDYKGKGVPDIRKHYAIHHQLWWTEENPEGSADRSHNVKILKLKKFLNCPKCNKQINFAQYYDNHLEWCGREHLTYECEHCHKENLMLRWQQLHLKTCPALVAQMKKERKKEKEEMEEEEEENEDENSETPGRGRKRKAAKRAMTMVHNISKETDPTAYSDHSDNDPDVVIHDDEDDEEDDDNDDDDINDEESIHTPDEDDEDLVDDYDVGDESGAPLWQRSNFFNPYQIMEEYIKENWSQELFLDWLPRKQDWKQLSEQESVPYLPKVETSMRFCFHEKDSPTTLETYQSVTVDGSPLFYTGLAVWQVAWCPTGLQCSDNQFLAVTGKTDHSKAFLTDERWTGHGIIQIWDTGISSNKLETKAVPKLCYNMVHNYGHATQMVWCPSGCYKTNKNQADAESYVRLGLLAVSFTDGTCRIFSFPHLPVTSDGAAPTYRASPVLTLIPYSGYEQDKFTCSSMDWIKTEGHTKVLLGYSTGFVRLFNLLSKSPFQRLIKNSEEKLLPYLSLRPHGNLVRAVNFCSVLDNFIVTSSEDFETYFWDLSNLGSPIHYDSGSYMTMRLFTSLLQHGVFVASDENYAVLSNKARYVDSGHLMYCGQPLHRKDEKSPYYISSQPACIWEIECSDWLGLVAACDNRGCVHGTVMKDLLKMLPDCKSYRYRQILFKTTIKEDAVEEKQETNESVNKSDKAEKCKKCSCVQSADSLYNNDSKDSQSAESLYNNDSKDSQSADSLYNNDDSQSETRLECTCNLTDQTLSKIDISSEKQTDNKCLRKGPGKMDKSSTTGSKEIKQEQIYQTLVSKSILQFNEHFKVPMYCSQDKDSDRYDRPSIAAIKSLSFNPNHQQCCWLAFGGNTGLVRLVNVQKMVSRTTHHHLRAAKQI